MMVRNRLLFWNLSIYEDVSFQIFVEDMMCILIVLKMRSGSEKERCAVELEVLRLLQVAQVDIHRTQTLLSLLRSPTSVTSLSCQATSCVGVCVFARTCYCVLCGFPIFACERGGRERLEMKLRRRVMDRARQGSMNHRRLKGMTTHLYFFNRFVCVCVCVLFPEERHVEAASVEKKTTYAIKTFCILYNPI